MLFGLDPVYWLFVLPGVLLGLWAQARVKSTFARFSQRTTRGGLSGAQVAHRILAANGIGDVRVEPVPGRLSDHYDPRSKTLRLSEPVYASNSMAALGVAAHEAGHAIQHARGYAPLGIRSAIVPLVGFGSNAGILVIVGAILMGGTMTPLGTTLAWIGIGLFGTTTLFTLVTLPVEFDASRRALSTLEQGGHMTPDELAGARKVLDAAAMTYVAAFVGSLLTLLYFAFRLGLLGGRRSD